MLLYYFEYCLRGEWVRHFDTIVELEPRQLSNFITAYKGEIIAGEHITVEKLRIKRFHGPRPRYTVMFDGEFLVGAIDGKPQW